MIPPDKLVVLDTNILVHLVREDALGRWVDSTYQLSARSERPLISVVTVGESLALARKFRWGQQQREKLFDLLRQLVVMDVGKQAVLEKYAEISEYLRTKGPIEQNDMWIAACTAVAGAHLITTDKHFGALCPDHIQRDWVDPHGSYS